MQTNSTSSTARHRIRHGIKSKLSRWTTILVQTTANFINQVFKSSDQSGPHDFVSYNLRQHILAAYNHLWYKDSDISGSESQEIFVEDWLSLSNAELQAISG